MLTVIATTDGKYVGFSMPIDPRNPPEVIEVGDGTRFEPESWTEIEAGKWRIKNANYTVLAVEA